MESGFESYSYYCQFTFLAYFVTQLFLFQLGVPKNTKLTHPGKLDGYSEEQTTYASSTLF